MSRSDFYMCKVMASDGPKDVPEDAIRFYHRAGFDEARLTRYRERFGQFGASIAPLPAGTVEFKMVSTSTLMDESGGPSLATATLQNTSASTAQN